MNEESIRDLLTRVYVEGDNPHRSDPTLSQRLIQKRGELATAIQAMAQSAPHVRGPVNIDNHHLIEWPITKGLPGNSADFDRATHPPIGLYLIGRICAFAPWVAFSWLALGTLGGEATRESFSLLDPKFLLRFQELEDVALGALESSECLELECLSEELLGSPAPKEWPTEFWMPEAPELGHFIFPGFFES